MARASRPEKGILLVLECWFHRGDLLENGLWSHSGTVLNDRGCFHGDSLYGG